MKQHRVLLLSDHPLLSEGLANVLGKLDDLFLIGPRTVTGFALSELDACIPDVVVFAAEQTDDAAANNVLLQILQYVPDLPVIQIGLAGSSSVRVYASHTLPARSADLISAIRKLPVQCFEESTDEPANLEE